MPPVPLDELIEAYAFDPPVRVSPFGAGRIHHSFRLQTGQDETWLLQRLNAHVFPDLKAMARNVRAVTDHLASLPPRHLADGRRRPHLSPRCSTRGQIIHRSTDGAYWRVYRFIEGTVPAVAPNSLDQIEQAAERYGEFLRDFDGYPADRLAITIAHFHDTPRRYRALQQSLQEDRVGRAGGCTDVVAFAEERRALASALESACATAHVPRRVVHNDCKLDNVLFDAATGEAVCVVDLDTVMAGLAWHDIGDLIRSATATGDEEQGDLEVDVERFEAVVRGYLRGTDGILTAPEIEHLCTAGRVIAYELGLRFLTDHLSGDLYFRVAAVGDNLLRARRQFALLASMERQADRLAQIVRVASGA